MVYLKEQGSKSGGAEPRAPLHSPAAPSNFFREPKDVLVSIHYTFKWLLKMQLGSLEKNTISSPEDLVVPYKVLTKINSIFTFLIGHFKNTITKVG